MSNHQLHTRQPFVARTLHRFAIPVILAWIGFVVVMGLTLPTLEQVSAEHSVSLNPEDAPAFIAAKRISDAFKENDSGSMAFLVLEGEQPLGPTPMGSTTA